MASEVPLVYHGGAVGFISATSQVAFDDVRVGAETVANPNNPKQPAEQVQQPLSIDTETNNLFADISNGNSSASLWQAISGEWRFEQGAYTQTQLDGFDLSMIYQHAFNSPFTMLTTFQLKEGSGGGGLLFNLPAANTKNGGYMVRYFENGSVLAWGYFDENGAFFGQGSVSVTPAEKDVHTLGVHVSDQSYSIELDGTEMAGNVPLRATTVTGYLGLTASQSVVTFNDVSVSAPINQTMPMANIDTELATGNWVVESNTISQLDTGNMDFVAGTGLAGERFTFKADITLPPDNTNAGAGIVFHMDGRDDLSLGYMVRFGNGGRELFWGQYDEVGNFVGKGGIPLEPTAGIKRELMLVVHDTSLDIWLDGMSIVKAIPLERSSGWIGLISFSGPVSFSNVNLQLGE
ncbi:MAG: hypothetical protein R3E39_03775 [Anaerolineae bacterium]